MTALWLVSIPLVDCIAVMASRTINGIMPFRPGREHLHHRLLNIKIKPKRILIIFVISSILLSMFGFLIELSFPNKEYISFYAFCALSFFYYLISKNSIKKNV